MRKRSDKKQNGSAGRRIARESKRHKLNASDWRLSNVGGFYGTSHSTWAYGLRLAAVPT